MARCQISLGDLGLSRVHFVFKLAFLIVFGKEVGLIQAVPPYPEAKLRDGLRNQISRIQISNPSFICSVIMNKTNFLSFTFLISKMVIITVATL